MPMTETELPLITPTELKSRLDAGSGPVVVDVREHFERRIADLPYCDQIRIPMGELPDRLTEIDARRDDESPDVVVYCKTGGRGGWATSFLIGEGRAAVYNLEGGVMGWREEVDPSLPKY